MFVLFLLFGVAAADFELLALHTNDMHSTWSGIDAGSTPSENYLESDYGGYLRLKAKKGKVEFETQKTGRSVLFLNAGDNFLGTPWFSSLEDEKDKVELTATFIKDLEFDAFCPGNHEFDLGIPAFIKFFENAGKIISATKKYLKYPATCYANEAEFNADVESAWTTFEFTNPANWYGEEEEVPIVVAANLLIERRDTGLHNTLRRSVVRIFQTPEGEIVPVGIIGYLTFETQKDLPKDGWMTIVDEMKYVAKEARRLTAMGIKIIIALGHSGFEIDEKIATILEIDAVIGGHSNTFMYNSVGDFVDKQPESIRTADDPPVLSYPVLVQTDRGFTPVVQAFAYIKYLGKLALDFDGNGDLKLKSLTNKEEALSTFTTSDPVQNPILLNDKLSGTLYSSCLSSIDLKSGTSFTLLIPKAWTEKLHTWQAKFETVRKMTDAVPMNLPKLEKYLEGGDICRRRHCVLAGAVADSYIDEFNTRISMAASASSPASPADAPADSPADNANEFKDLIGFTNGGAVRTPIGDIFTSPAKPKYVSSWDIMIVVSLNGDVGIVKLTAASLIEAFKYSITQWKDSDPSGRLLQVSSNVRVTYDFDEMIDHPVNNKPIRIPTPRVEVLDRSDMKFYDISTARFKNTLFNVVTSGYLAGGKGGYSMLKSTMDTTLTPGQDWPILNKFIADTDKLTESRKNVQRILFAKKDECYTSIPRSWIV